MLLTSLYRADRTNPGDWHSPPKRYYDYLRASTELDIDRMGTRPDGLILIGGGSLFGQYPGHVRWTRLLEESADANAALWGVGLACGERYPSFVSRYGLVGVRDYGVGLP